MPVWLLRLLPYAGVVLALGGFVWWIDRNAATRTRQQIEAQAAKSEIQMRKDLRDSETRLGVDIEALASGYDAQRAALGQTAANLQPIIIKEAARDPRFTDPAAGITPGMLAAINRARETGTCSAAASGRIVCAMPAAPAAHIGGDR